MRNLISRANSKYVLFCFFFFFLNTLRDLYSKVYTDGSLKLKKKKKLCLYEQQTDVGRVEELGRQKAYKVVGMMSAALTSTLKFDWQHGQGFQSVLASHLHLLIKCHNNMIFNYQQLPCSTPALEKKAAAGESKLK